MNKPFNGISGRIAKINESDHIVSTREDLLDWSVVADSGTLDGGDFSPAPNALVGDLTQIELTGGAESLADELIVIDEGGHAGEVVVLDCLEPKEMLIRYYETHGGVPGDNSFSILPSDLSEIADEGPS